MSKELIEVEVGIRLDKAVSDAFPTYSRASIEKLIENGAITVNGQQVKSKYIIKDGDIVQADFSALYNEPEQIELPIIYEDGDVVVINKPVGVLAHAKGAFNNEATVATWLKSYCTGFNPDEKFWLSNRAGIVHRLDRGTSGVMIVAKNEDAQKFLQKQFAKRNVKKTYLAVIAGELPENEGLIDIPIERNPKKPATFRAGINGKSAQTEFKVLKSDGKHSLVELQPKTGRTHQLRVHLNYLKHPIVGDEFYGGESANRLMLHAQKLEITLPGGKRMAFEAPLPLEFENFA